jgi:hypothetical protein
LRKCFLTGVNRARLVAKQTAAGTRAATRLGALRAKASGLLDAVVRAQEGTLPQFIVYLPVMLLFEFADAAGYTIGRLGWWRRAPSESGAAAPFNDA